MHKLVILIEPQDNPEAFDRAWPKFLHAAENMPGLLSEATCRVEAFLFGSYKVNMLHELHFASLEDAQAAMASAHGRLAGQVLQSITGGKLTLFLSDHKQDALDNIRKYQPGEAPAAPAAGSPE